MNGRRRLIVNADDFGFTRGVNQGILEAHQEGIVTAATLMAMGPAFRHAVDLARSVPTLDVGCHLVLTGLPSALPPHHPLPASVDQLVAAVVRRRLRIRDELRAQVRRLLDADITPTHLDTHKHTHLLPAIAEAVGELASEFHIRWVRRPLLPRAVSRLLEGRMLRHGSRVTDHFRGFGLTGRLNTASLVRLLRGLKPGLTELMCHPGRLDDELCGAATRLKESREQELRALTSPEVKAAVREGRIELTGYRWLG